MVRVLGAKEDGVGDFAFREEFVRGGIDVLLRDPEKLFRGLAGAFGVIDDGDEFRVRVL